MTRHLALFLFAALASQSALADLKWFYCYAPDPVSGKLFMSERLPVGPIPERAGYGDEFTRFLRGQGLIGPGVQGYCVMRSTEAEIQRGMDDLPGHCRECNGATRVSKVTWGRGTTALAGTGSGGSKAPGGTAPGQIWTPSAGGLPGSGAPPTSLQSQPGTTIGTTAPQTPSQPPPGTAPVPYEIMAALPHVVYVPLHGRPGNRNAGVNYRFIVCGYDIYLSYSVIAEPDMNLYTLRFSGTTFGNHVTFRFLDPQAKYVPGARMGCGYQKLWLSSLKQFEPALVSGRFLDGTIMWSREEMIEHLLGRFSVFAVEPSP